MQQKTPGAVVSAIRQVDDMIGIGYNSQRGYGYLEASIEGAACSLAVDALKAATALPSNNFRAGDISGRLFSVFRHLGGSWSAALAIPDSLRRQRWVPASPRGQHADR